MRDCGVSSCGEPGRCDTSRRPRSFISTRSAQRGAEFTNHGVIIIENTAPARKLWFHGSGRRPAGAPACASTNENSPMCASPRPAANATRHG